MAQTKNFHKNINAWYITQGRQHLPWRNTNDPYAIWISETMLQQTQVKTVLERFYFPFLETFPSVPDLAQASPEQVLKKWEGLGYYTRARNLHKAAKICVERFGGKLPQTVDELLELPGIGMNTAHAIASFAYHHNVPVMEANVKRVLARIYCMNDVKSPQSVKILWKKAQELLGDNDPFIHNQAMMDVGSQICTPKNPSCPICPLYLICKGKDAPELYPERVSKKQTPTRHSILWINMIGFGENLKIGIETRSGNFLGGLSGFPLTETQTDVGEVLGEIKHVYSHFTRIAEVRVLNQTKPDPNLTYYTLEEMDELALSKLDHKALTLLSLHLNR